jgi:hypothetical protein
VKTDWPVLSQHLMKSAQTAFVGLRRNVVVGPVPKDIGEHKKKDSEVRSQNSELRIQNSEFSNQIAARIFFQRAHASSRAFLFPL